ncbi:uncharacterized protein LOC124168402 [Ischnura elegans]|uniref:uncharacterized protein LOC124168402 n=1 Tax=Ischnura elegans TaxID=197161 RepID=UPI001ED87A08|nr:uncharacterized protein LOC124168402 [Ischnura elegans]
MTIADPPRLTQVHRKKEDDVTQSASQPKKAAVMCNAKEIRPGCSPNLESRSKPNESLSRKSNLNPIPTFNRHLALSSSQGIPDIESTSGSVKCGSNQVDGGLISCINCSTYKNDIAKVQAQLNEIVSILRVDMVE